MRLAAFLVPVLLAAGPAQAGDGRSEINQALVEAAGGFPYTIVAPGSYVLTSDLRVTAPGTDALVLATSQVTLDLNGFAIHGPFVCSGDCRPTAGSGIRPASGIDGQQTVVRDGAVRGFGASCVELGAQSSVEELLVTHCGGDGIRVAGGSLVLRNRVLTVGNDGIVMSGSPPPSYAANSVSDVGGGWFLGGIASPGNTCDPGCEPAVPRPRLRRYYLTPALHAADQMLTACLAGYHSASLWEIFHTAALEYDVLRGFKKTDSGGGPPGFPGISQAAVGWVRSGAGSAASLNCLDWTTTEPANRGLIVSLGDQWDSTFQEQRISPWLVGERACDALARVWCVED